MDILKNTDAMGKRIFADLEKINFIRKRGYGSCHRRIYGRNR